MDSYNVKAYIMVEAEINVYAASCEEAKNNALDALRNKKLSEVNWRACNAVPQSVRLVKEDEAKKFVLGELKKLRPDASEERLENAIQEFINWYGSIKLFSNEKTFDCIISYLVSGKFPEVEESDYKG